MRFDVGYDELWASSEWEQRTAGNHRWLRESAEELGRDIVDGYERRWFAPKRKMWPLLCVSVYQNYPKKPPGVLISVSHKTDKEAWFEDCTLPPVLVPVLIEMLCAK